MTPLPLLLRRAELRQLLKEHGIGDATMRAMIADGRIERRYLPPGSAPETVTRRAFFSLAQVRNDILAPLTGSVGTQ